MICEYVRLLNTSAVVPSASLRSWNVQMGLRDEIVLVILWIPSAGASSLGNLLLVADQSVGMALHLVERVRTTANSRRKKPHKANNRRH